MPKTPCGNSSISPAIARSTAVDAGDAVAERHHRADFRHVDVDGEAADLLADDLRDLVSFDAHRYHVLRPALCRMRSTASVTLPSYTVLPIRATTPPRSRRIHACRKSHCLAGDARRAAASSARQSLPAAAATAVVTSASHDVLVRSSRRVAVGRRELRQPVELIALGQQLEQLRRPVGEAQPLADRADDVDRLRGSGSPGA